MFHDIFQKRKVREKTESKKLVKIDFREKNSLVPSELVNLNFNIEFVALPVADYLIDNVAIERKTVSDLKSSIIDRRIFTQLKELKQYPKHLLIIEGEKENLYNNESISENAIRGFLLSTQLDFAVPCIFTKNEKETAKYIEILSNKKRENKEIILPKKISLNIQEQKSFILQSFPSIGPKKASLLLDKFKSLKNVFNASEDDLKEIIGKNTKVFLELLLR